jgi:hypothetical protein
MMAGAITRVFIISCLLAMAQLDVTPTATAPGGRHIRPKLSLTRQHAPDEGTRPGTDS